MANFIAREYKKHGAIALILAGSVAKGTERADSDLDGMVIVSEEEYAEKEKNNTTTETIDGFCTYEGGYDFQEWWREPRPNIKEW